MSKRASNTSTLTGMYGVSHRKNKIYYVLAITPLYIRVRGDKTELNVYER